MIDLTTVTDVLQAAFDDPSRLAQDLLRDPSSKPAEVLQFIGFAPDMNVLDVNAASGYNTELVARIVGDRGHVIAHNHPGAFHLLPPQDLQRRYGCERLPNTEQIWARHNDLNLVSASLDAVLMSMVYHDIYWFDAKVAWGPIDQRALLLDLREALRPGGVIGVIDHYASAGSDPAESAMATHRIDPAIVRRDFLAAGFELAAESELLRNRDDDYALSVFDTAVHGKTDRFVMRFRRPS
jgi:predicted methyltransferase